MCMPIGNGLPYGPRYAKLWLDSVLNANTYVSLPIRPAKLFLGTVQSIQLLTSGGDSGCAVQTARHCIASSQTLQRASPSTSGTSGTQKCTNLLVFLALDGLPSGLSNIRCCLD